jgi:hypothetical protein
MAAARFSFRGASPRVLRYPLRYRPSPERSIEAEARSWRPTKAIRIPGSSVFTVGRLPDRSLNLSAIPSLIFSAAYEAFFRALCAIDPETAKVVSGPKCSSHGVSRAPS